jgi:hypothetical protein
VRDHSVTARASRFVLFAGGNVATGAFPRAALGLQVGLGLALSPLRVDVSARWLPRSKHPVSTPEGAGAAFELLAAQARVAYLFRDRVGPAVALEVGSARASGYGVSTPMQGSAAWYAASIGLFASMRSGDVGLAAELMAVVPLTRPDFVVENAGVAHTPAAIGLRAGLAGEVRF